MEKGSDLRGLQITLGIYVFIFIMKLVAYLYSGIMALLAESLHTLSDIFVAGFLLVATIYSRKKADQTHMFGYGRAQNVAALVAATLFISFTSFELFRESIPRLFKSAETTHQNIPLALGVLIVSMIFAASPLIMLLKQKKRGASAKAMLMELVNDELGLLAALIGVLLIQAGVPIADPIAALVVAVIIAYNAIGLFRENMSFLIGRSPRKEYLDKLKEAALSVPGVIAVRNLRAEYIGPDLVHAGMQLEVKPGITVEEADRIVKEADKRIHRESEKGYCFIQIAPGRARNTR